MINQKIVNKIIDLYNKYENLGTIQKIVKKERTTIKRILERSGVKIKKQQGSHHRLWKGDKVGYGSLHDWLRRNFLIPKNCQRCHKESKLDCANISGEYKRDITDFEWICRSCHAKSDGRIKNIHKSDLKSK